MRAEHFYPTEIVNDVTGDPKCKTKLVLEKCGKYFDKLLRISSETCLHHDNNTLGLIEPDPDIVSDN